MRTYEMRIRLDAEVIHEVEAENRQDAIVKFCNGQSREVFRKIPNAVINANRIMGIRLKIRRSPGVIVFDHENMIYSQNYAQATIEHIYSMTQLGIIYSMTQLGICCEIVQESRYPWDNT